jgi:hypothetical protein
MSLIMPASLCTLLLIFAVARSDVIHDQWDDSPTNRLRVGPTAPQALRETLYPTLDCSLNMFAGTATRYTFPVVCSDYSCTPLADGSGSMNGVCVAATEPFKLVANVTDPLSLPFSCFLSVVSPVHCLRATCQHWFQFHMQEIMLVEFDLTL